ncbi:MAG: proline--tRNA ligase [Phycisphaerae bacterium]|nr:proline--tRNA ligase [Phycisphaerae bacterium]
MRYTQLLIPTVKETPAEAEVPSHQLMIRAGLIRKLASGTYTYLPLGWRSLLKIIEIVRAEMNTTGAQEILMPILQPVELWQQTGRDVVYDEILCRFIDHHGRENVLAPTAEESVTALVAGEIGSYRQLPINLYQIHTKFRDEFRPQYGVIRSREFLMKDAYSFDATVEGLNESYRKMYDAYCRIFDGCGLTYQVVEASSGGMGGSDTEEFMVPSTVGDVIVAAEDGSYAANIERATVDPLPLTAQAKSARTSAPAMQEVHTPGIGSIEAVCKFLGTQPPEMIKTLIYETSTRPAEEEISKKMSYHDGEVLHTSAAYAVNAYAVLVRGDHDVNQGKLDQLAGGPVALASEGTIRELSGAAVGFAGAMGLAGKVSKFIVDHAVAAMGMGVTGANKTYYHVKNIVPGRDFPLKGPNVIVADIRNAVEGDTWQGKKLIFSHGIEVGHVFKLGTKYSEKLGATFLDEKGKSHPCVMGCYGIGINRILAAAIETGHDDDGCILPISIAPFEVLVVPLNADKPPVVAEAQRIHDELSAGGVEVLLDDRDARPGVKLKDADLIGIPLRVVVGERGLKERKVEIKRRTDATPTLVPAPKAVAEVRRIIDEMKAQLLPTRARSTS